MNLLGADIAVCEAHGDSGVFVLRSEARRVRYLGKGFSTSTTMHGFVVMCDLDPSCVMPIHEDFSPPLPDPEPGVILVLPPATERAAVAMGRTDVVRVTPIASGKVIPIVMLASSLPGGPVVPSDVRASVGTHDEVPDVDAIVAKWQWQSGMPWEVSLAQHELCGSVPTYSAGLRAALEEAGKRFYADALASRWQWGAGVPSEMDEAFGSLSGMCIAPYVPALRDAIERSAAAHRETLEKA